MFDTYCREVCKRLKIIVQLEIILCLENLTVIESLQCPYRMPTFMFNLNTAAHINDIWWKCTRRGYIPITPVPLERSLKFRCLTKEELPITPENVVNITGRLHSKISQKLQFGTTPHPCSDRGEIWSVDPCTPNSTPIGACNEWSLRYDVNY